MPKIYYNCYIFIECSFSHYEIDSLIPINDCLKCILSDIIPTMAFTLMVVSWYIFFHIFTFNVSIIS